MATNDDNELIDSFVTESMEMLDEVEPIFLALTAEHAWEMSADSVGAAFRLYHSIKGAASFLGFPNVTGITHTAETLLGMLRSGNLTANGAFVEVQLETIDVLREIFGQIQQTRNDDGRDAVRQEIVTRLEAVMKGGDLPAEENVAVELVATEECDAVAESPAPPPPSAAEEASEEEAEALEFTISDEMRLRFCQDSADILDEAEQALLSMETPDAELRAKRIAETFRNLHSFKGNCGFMQLVDMETLSHKMENVLDAMREGGVAPNESNVSLLLKNLDLLRGALADVQAGGEGRIKSCRAMVQFIDDMVLGQVSPATPEPEPAATSAAKTPKPVAPEQAVAPKIAAEAPPTVPVAPQPEPAARSQPVESSPEKPVASKAGENGESNADQGESPGRAAASAPSAAAQNKGSIRVDVDKLDTLINLVGELIIAEAMVLRNSSLLDIENEALERGIHQLKRVSTDLQDVAMSVRMIPLAATFRRMIRLVHDTSRKSQKQASLKLIGEDTEVDKNVIEQIGDPLVHIIRNSVDHGIEPAEERVAIGKHPEGTIELEGRHEGGEVWILIRDDGRGLNREKILAKAQERNLLPGKPEEMEDDEIYALIFHPGFSTADKITDVSGRGVGMDVVKKNIEKLNGKVRVKSAPGKGTEVILQIPLTMAIIDGMLVRVGNSRYTLPLLAMRECIPYPTAEQVTITPDGVEMVMVRGDLIPVLRLHEVFKKTEALTDLSQSILVIVQSGNDLVALMVDELIGQQETVIKGLSPYLGTARGISGCTVLGDGEVSLIVDVEGLVRMRSGGVIYAE
jgi:two-component system, chemotaxis family, sensor kinase CheA